MDAIKIIPVDSRKLLDEFITLPYKVHRDHRLWVPPLVSDEKAFFDSRKNIAFRKNEAVLYVALRGKYCVGRVMGIINPEQNRKDGTSTARFGFLECYRDERTFGALMNSVESWAKVKGMKRIVGPMGFTDQDPEGFIVEGYEFEPTISTYYNFEYIPALLESGGYRKEIDYVVYLIDLSREVNRTHQELFRRFVSRTPLTLHSFGKKRELRPFIRPIMELMNETFRDLYGYSELTSEEIDCVVKRFWPLIDPRFVFAAERGNELAGFVIGIPNLSAGFRKCKGRLLPLGIMHLMRAAGKSRQLDLLVGGIKEEWRGTGLDVWGMVSEISAAKKAGFSIMDSHHELETNLVVRAEMERLGGKLAKRFRIFVKSLEGDPADGRLA